MRYFLLLLFFPLISQAQTDSTVNKKKLIIASTSVGVAYGASMVVLGNAWYSDAPKTLFHFFNDAPEWKQMDKAGHFFSGFHLSDNASMVLRSCNVSKRKSDIIGAVTGAVIMSSIEVFDGYSAAYGASASDVAANLTGSLFYLGQSWAWNEVRIHPKFSFHHTSLSKQRPDVLGSGMSEMLKNYNGQTLWLSVDVAKFVRNSKWPKWLSVAGGYGAENMLYARDSQNLAAGLKPYRQYYLSLDVDLTAIPVRSKFLKTVFKLVNMIKVPAPALEFSSHGVKAHALYF
ncbi:MAG: DUF2279 domain-containing protein [Bacteroidota bacterium]